MGSSNDVAIIEMGMAGTKREDRLAPGGPKRILAIDAAGPRAILAAALLGGLESMLRKERQDPELRLWDHFDLIGGGSSGALLAAALAAGASAEEACELFQDIGPEGKSAPRGDGVRRPKHESARLIACLEAAFGDAKIGDPRIRTGLAILVKPLGAAAPEIWANTPGAAQHDTRFVQAIRASLGGESLLDAEGGFADAALGWAANPVWPLLHFAMDPRGLNWPLGQAKLSITSLGAGRMRPDLAKRVFEAPPDANPTALAANIATRAAFALDSALFEANEAALAAMALLAHPQTPRTAPLLEFERLDVEMSPEHLASLGLSPTEISVAVQRAPISAASLALWRRIGEAAGAAASQTAKSEKPGAEQKPRARAPNRLAALSGLIGAPAKKP